ncbi:hypothetical protein M3P21_15720 [Ruegeria sp. 2012CJ41-6]|uniref:Uncharacterized protein n=1 Tax=Ruegeria spongiae TaxID=2942209 RepID=A0ABT0Q535_9RHOB|nr:hypothetical protein [Ruegeria spongiae]MCL6284980.1 hypothetical protein [Ruegeria spongiae]
MAKTTVTKHKFGVVDLIRSKPKLQYIELPKYKVDVQFEITTSGKLKKPDPVPSTALKRLEATGMKELERYETVITEEAVKLDAKVAEILKKTPGEKGKEAAEKLIQGTNQSIKNAMASAEGAAQVAIQKQLKVEGNKDKLLKEARVKTTLKVSMGVIKIGTAVARLVGSSGADVMAYKTIVKQVYNLGKEIQQQLKSEEKLRKDLYSAIQKYITLRGTTIMQAAERQGITDTSGISVKKPMEAIKKLTGKAVAMGDEVTKGRDPKKIAQELLDFTIKGIAVYNKDADKKRQQYREHTTKTRQKVDSLGVAADKLMKAAKAQKTLKEGIKLGAECMTLKREATAMAAKLEERQKFLGEMQTLMEGNGMKVDDTTIVDKIKALDKKTVLKEAKTMVTSVSGIYKLVDEISDIAA